MYVLTWLFALYINKLSDFSIADVVTCVCTHCVGGGCERSWIEEPDLSKMDPLDTRCTIKCELKVVNY